MKRHPILQSYDLLKTEVKAGFLHFRIAEILSDIYQKSIELLDNEDRIELKSKVEGKTYFAFKRGKKISRAINSILFNPNLDAWITFREAMKANSIDEISNENLSKLLYSMAISFCASVDLI